MPTFAKVTAAVFFAALGYFCADLIKPLLPRGTPAVWLNETLAALGAINGWIMSGKRAGDGTRAGIGYGLTTAALIVVWGVFIFAGAEMIELSIARRYGGPIEAIQAMVAIGLDYVRLIAVPEIIGSVVVGGIFGGWLTEWVAAR
jgi:hypothetical protein